MTKNTTTELKDISQKTITIFIKLMPYLTILSGLMIWYYLNNLGRLDLLLDSFSINIGLISLLISVIIFTLAIAITLTLPSSIIIFHYSIFQDITKRSVYLPWLGWILSALFLILAFLPHAPFIKKIISPPSALSIFFIIAILAFIICTCFSLLNYNFKNNSIYNKVRYIGKALIDTFTIIFATLSISIPVTFLLKNSTGERTISLLIALIFMIAFALLSFLPAIVYYYDQKNTEFNNKSKRIISLAKKISIAVMITMTITYLLFPNVKTALINSSLYSIGFIDNKNHHFLIKGDKYQPEMFPQHIWMTSTTNKIEKDFFIYGIIMFSAGNKKLICPDSVGKFKKDIEGTNYDLIISSNNEDNVKKLKDMTDICVVLGSDDAQQWDTFFERQ